MLLLNWLFRYGAKGDQERQVEADARDYYSQHGHWPDEKPRRSFALHGRVLGPAAAYRFLLSCS